MSRTISVNVTANAFYGWRIVGVSMFTQALQAGILIYAFGTLAVALEAEFGTTRSEVMVSAMILSIVTNLISPYLGLRVDKGSVRVLMTVAVIALGIALAAVGFAQSIVHVWLVFALIVPYANLLLGQLPTAALITRWFDRRRGQAMGISAVGTSLGGFIFPVLLSVMIGAFGWREALFVLGGAIVVVGAPLVWFVVIDRPEDAGLHPDGLPPEPQRAGTAADLALTEILRMPAFWYETVAIGLLLFIYMGFLANLVPHAVGVGIGNASASALMSIIAVLAIIGKLGFGTIADRIELRRTMWLAIALMLAGSVVLSRSWSYAGIAAGSALFGLAAGGLLPVWGAMVARSFGRDHFGRALGIMNLAMTPLTMLSAPFAGWVFDTTGGYAALFVAYIGLLVVAGLVLLPLRFPDAEAAP